MVQDDPNWVNHNGTNFSKLLVWQEGDVPRLLPLHNLYRDWDGVLNLWWSPDKNTCCFAPIIVVEQTATRDNCCATTCERSVSI